MSGSPGSAGSNPRKFSEKIALHNQKQAEETRAFEQLMTDLTVSRVQFQKIQQLRLSQTRAQYYGGSLPNVNQIGTVNTDFQGAFPTSPDVVRGTRHHGLVERVHRERSRVNSPHRRPMDKHGRQVESSPYGNAYLSPPPDNSWRRTNSDSALHTSAMNPNPQDPFGPEQQLGRVPPQRNVFSFPALASEEGLRGVSKPLPKQLWEAKKIQSLSSRPKSCEVPGISIFPSPEQSMGLSHYQGTLNTGGSLPDLSNLHFPSPLPTPLDPEDGRYPSLSGGSSTGNLPAAMMHLGIGTSQGLSSSLSNPSIHSSLRLSSLSASPPGALNSSPRRRPAPVSPLTLSPGSEPRRSLGKPLSPTMSPSLSPITQGVALDTCRLPMEPPPPYPMYKQSHPAVQQSSQRTVQAMSPLSNLQLDFNSSSQNNMASFFNDPFMEPQGPGCQSQSKALSYQLEQFSMLDCGMGSVGGASCLDPGSSLYYSQAALMGLDSGQSNLQESLQSRQNMLYSNCGGGVPNIILTDDSNPSQSKDISRALSAVPECFDSEGGFPLEDELRIEPLSLDGLSMLSDPDMVLPDPSVEDSFRSDRL
ncbi:CREB-regulated transcription coactivator 3 isoform X5 [Brienomyrus brachyistius]|uniref:CREB-regulated transcription coactivator 3 isoform X5 n=1 Tax=Brienomyrus brachyistius TaxID=42636 RepID=UPI0020B20F3A|nr:CREB-regulated transcription coactivator 3 isoform X5 [Brienomyrus brachyistius]